MSPRLIVEVRGGRANGTKVVIDPGGKLRFGRTDLADVVVPGDELLGGVHFELGWDGRRASLKDRRSLEGTTLNGAKVARTEVPHGGWIRAGRTDFLVYVEGHGLAAPARDEGHGSEYGLIESTDDSPESEPEAGDELDPSDTPERRAAADLALQRLRAEAARQPLFAVLDAARDERILPILRESIERHQSLYEGVDGEALEDVAPYLAGPMRADSMLLDRLVLGGWGRRWGIYVTSPSPFREVRRHLRRFLMVDLVETEEKVYFRFYDPWVMEQFLPLSNEAQKRELGLGLTTLFHERGAGDVGAALLGAPS